MLADGLVRLWENPEVIALNKLPPRASFEAVPTAALARSGAAEHPWKLPLDGEWEFHLAADPVAGEAAARGAAPVEWGTIRVPGHWQLQGHGHPHYTNITMPFREEPPRVPAANATGVYRRRFQVPAAWEGMRVVAHFGAADSMLAVWLDGVLVGLSKDSRLPAEFDLTPLLRPGATHVLAATVTRWSDASFIEDQDMWWMNGLVRPTWLHATPRAWIADFQLRPTLEGDDLAVGVLAAAATLGFDGAPPEGCVAELQVLSPAGKPLLREPATATIRVDRHPQQPSRLRAEFSVRVRRPATWSAETPRLHRAVLTLRTPLGTSHASLRFGFRRVEVRGRDVLVNGRRVLFHGVNRHEHHPDTGRALDLATMEEDIRLLKRANVNAVRTSHYPADPRFLDFCDEAGLYVVAEANVEAHDFHNQLCRDPRYAAAWLDRCLRMAVRDAHHASILAWSLGNESGHGPNHDAAAGWLRHFDPHRLVHYEGAISRWQSHRTWDDGRLATDLVCPMYPSLEEMLGWLRKAKDPRPMILCEYSHAMGNSNGSLADYYRLFRAEPGLQGGFIWEWVDHGLRQRLPDGSTRWAYGGDFGESPHDGNFVCDGLVGPDRVPHPGLEEFRHLAQPVECVLARPAGRTGEVVVEVRNRRDFTGLRDLRATWEAQVDGVVRARGVFRLPEVAPGRSAKATVKLPARVLAAGGERHLLVRVATRAATPWVPAGHVVAWDQLALGEGGKAKASRVPSRAPEPTAYAEEGERWVLAAGGLRVTVDPASAAWSGLAVHGSELLAAPARLEAWRAATDNDGLKLWTGQGSKPLGRWLGLGLDRGLVVEPGSARVSRGPRGSLEVRLATTASTRGNPADFVHRQVLRLQPEGVLEVEQEVLLGPDPVLQDLPRLGLRLELVPGLDRARWFGLGPHETYPDRLDAAWLGVFGPGPADPGLPYVMPQEYGHRMGLRWLELGPGPGSALPGLRLAWPGKDGQANLCRHAPEDLFAARHAEELRPRAGLVVHVDGAHRGLGTGSCGPDTRPEYRLRGRRFRWRFAVRAADREVRPPRG